LANSQNNYEICACTFGIITECAFGFNVKPGTLEFSQAHDDERNLAAEMDFRWVLARVLIAISNILTPQFVLSTPLGAINCTHRMSDPTDWWHHFAWARKKKVGPSKLRLRAIATSIIQSKRANKAAGMPLEGPSDLLSAMIEAGEETDERMIDQIFTFMRAVKPPRIRPTSPPLRRLQLLRPPTQTHTLNRDTTRPRPRFSGRFWSSQSAPTNCGSAKKPPTRCSAKIHSLKKRA
jgi:hypothetical protein